MIIWPLLTFALVALTKYATSIRLRNLRDKIRKDLSEADDLRHLLFQSIESKEIIETEKKENILVLSLQLLLTLEAKMKKISQV